MVAASRVLLTTLYTVILLMFSQSVLLKWSRVPKFRSLETRHTFALRSQPILKSEYACLKEWNVDSSSIKDTNISVFDYLCSETDNYFATSTQIKKAIRKGLVLLNGNKTNTSTNITSGDIIKYVVRSHVETNFSSTIDTEKSSEKSDTAVSKDMTKCSVIWEDEYVAVVFKPQGVPVFNTRTNQTQSSESDGDSVNSSANQPVDDTIEQSLHSLVLTQLSPAAQGPLAQPLRRPRLAHRLDQGTGGLLVVAKTHPALAALTAAFAERRVNKHYRALVAGKLTSTPQYQLNRGSSGAMAAEQSSVELFYNSSGQTVVGRIVWDDSSGEGNVVSTERLRGTISSPLDGKDAVTDWSVIDHTMTHNSGWVTTVDAFPHTGRNHQIRRHLDSVGHPILGDPDYWFTQGRRTSAKYFQRQTAMYPLLQVCDMHIQLWRLNEFQ